MQDGPPANIAQNNLLPSTPESPDSYHSAYDDPEDLDSNLPAPPPTSPSPPPPVDNAEDDNNHNNPESPPPPPDSDEESDTTVTIPDVEGDPMHSPASTDPDDEENEDEVFDPQQLICELNNENESGWHLQNWETYCREKAALLDQTVEISSGRESVTWKVRSDIKKEQVLDQDKEYVPVGVVGFDFRNQPIHCPDGKNKCISFLDLLIHLWPGDWQKQLEEVNFQINEENETTTKTNVPAGFAQLKQCPTRSFGLSLESFS